jgi:hypothetical protein
MESAPRYVIKGQSRAKSTSRQRGDGPKDQEKAEIFFGDPLRLIGSEERASGWSLKPKAGLRFVG